MKKFNYFHLVNISPWPLTTSLSFLRFALGVIIMVRNYLCYPFLFSLVFLLISSYLWGQDIHREACYEGDHNLEVISGFKIGIIFFILSECFFFSGYILNLFTLSRITRCRIRRVMTSLRCLLLWSYGYSFS